MYYLAEDHISIVLHDDLNFMNKRYMNLSGGFSNKFFGSEVYLIGTAKSKMQYLWDEITRDNNSWNFPSAMEMAKIFIETMDPTFTTPGDAMKDWGYWRGKKYIHAVGVTGRVKFQPVSGSPYTGIFKGANLGLIRLSSATQPTPDGKLGPGMGLKFLRDGIDSANLVAMYRVDGQPGDWNFFANSFETTIPDSQDTGVRLLARKFSSATDFVQSCGLSDFAAFDQTGQAPSRNVFPFKLRFQPSSAVHTMFPKELQNGNAMAYMDQLKSVPANTTLYDVYAWDASPQLGGTEKKIGSLQLDGKLVSSRWGDEHLFFRHQKLSDDIKLRPAWDDYLPRASFSRYTRFSKSFVQTDMISNYLRIILQNSSQILI